VELALGLAHGWSSVSRPPHGWDLLAALVAYVGNPTAECLALATGRLAVGLPPVGSLRTAVVEV
jgi:hypothetical protein